MNYSVIGGCEMPDLSPLSTEMCPWLKTLAQKGLECAEGCCYCLLLASPKVGRVAGRDQVKLHSANKINW